MFPMAACMRLVAHYLLFSSHPDKVFFFNEISRATSWTLPTGTEEKVPETVCCRHLLVKHTGVRNPRSKRTSQRVTLSRQEALQYVKKIHEKLKKERLAVEKNESSETSFEDTFSRTAKAESDCSSFRHGGNLEPFKKTGMQKAFSAPAFALRVHEMSGIVESNSGYHIIYRTK